MAEDNGSNGGQPAGNAAPGGAAPGGAAQQAPQNLGVLAQYVKDLSFESPGAPQSLRERGAPPAINITTPSTRSSMRAPVFTPLANRAIAT